MRLLTPCAALLLVAAPAPAAGPPQHPTPPAQYPAAAGPVRPQVCPCDGGPAACGCPRGGCPGACPGPAATPPPPPPSAADPAGACVRVSHSLGGSATAVGSGTVVACEGGRSLVLTNRHVVEGGDPASFAVASGGRRHPARLLAAADPGGPDLALLVVDAALPSAAVAAELPECGTVVAQRGYGGGSESPSFKAGLVHPPYLPGPTTHTSIPAEQGDSGAGVVDPRTGEVVAVTWGAVAGGPRAGLGCAVPVNYVHALVRHRPAVRSLFPRLAARLDAARLARLGLSEPSLILGPATGATAPAAPAYHTPPAFGCPGGVCRPGR